jgi:hypothetical protein
MKVRDRMAFGYKPFNHVAPDGLTAPEPRHKVVITGAGPVWLAIAVELANHGVASIVLDDYRRAVGRSAGPSGRCRFWTVWAKVRLVWLKVLAGGSGAFFIATTRCSTLICCPMTGTRFRSS